MSQLTRRQFGAAAGTIAAAAIIPVRGRAAEVLKFGHITDEANTWHLAAMEFARLVNDEPIVVHHQGEVADRPVVGELGAVVGQRAQLRWTCLRRIAGAIVWIRYGTAATRVPRKSAAIRRVARPCN